MDQIRIENLELFCNHGALPEENVLGQKFYISAILYLNTRDAGKKDDLQKSVHYGEVCQRIKQIMEQHTFQLIERCCEVVAETILLEYPLVSAIDLEVKKPWAPIGLPVEYVSVSIHREWHTVYLGVGSNMGDKEGYLNFAIEQLKNSKDIQVTKVAKYRTTEPYGGVEQDDFLNSCIEIKTLQTPEELLITLHDIEQKAGRERKVHWGPRTLDLDILLYDNVVMDTKELTIPHKEMHLREFVLEPLTEIAPYAEHPIYHCSARELFERLKRS
jgi:dihydroneopterin aldolase/2-amino-4-hydroxy-6-hydroxymethyldihydropteridine diphosphokinase